MAAGRTPKRPPKALLFDIGGVCVRQQVQSPFQAIADYERRNAIPQGWINFAISRSSPHGAWQRLERGGLSVGQEFFADFHRDLHREASWREFCCASKRRRKSALNDIDSPMPRVDGTALFGEMMRVASMPDPWIYPALRKLRTSSRFILGALSNTAIFAPEWTESIDVPNGLRAQFDVFVSSAHVGLRKPDRRIYELALRELNEFAKAKMSQQCQKEYAASHIEGDVKPDDVVFLDDIGENLKAARNLGMRTIKVQLGKGKEAVKELELLTGLKLLEERSRSML
ncbi:MAG: hypothetical protein M1816_001829 [Peltula sp. TS41687]|nr:MAG: hypothetical protein M1816_001829 [Peltula sp. TS41687]